MSVRHDVRQLLAHDEIVAAPEQRSCTDRTFGLPVVLHTGFFGLFVTYLGVMAVGFPHPEMILPMAIFVIFTAAFYVVPMLWAVMQPPKVGKAMSMSDLLRQGMATHTGHSSGGAVVAQVMILPVLILLWGMAVVTIAALS